MSRVIVPTNNAELEYPSPDSLLFPYTAVQADDTPSRHPCKVRTSQPTNTSRGSWRMEPYKACVIQMSVLSCDDDNEENEDDEFTVAATIAQHELEAAASVPAAFHAYPQPQTQFQNLAPQQRHPSFSNNGISIIHSQQKVAPSPIAPASIFSVAPEHPMTKQKEVSQGHLQCYQQPQQPIRSSLTSSQNAQYLQHQSSANRPRSNSGRSTAASTPAPSEAGSRRSSGIKYGIIQFKHLKDTFFVPSTERHGLQVGDFVVVEGDRGENVGQLIEDMTPTHQRNDPIAGRVVRKATLSDRRLWENARRRETEATAMCQVFAEEFDVEMFVSDTEFQTDLNKLTVYYSTTCGGPVDFRQMQRALFKHYRCRIWLVDLTNTELK